MTDDSYDKICQRLDDILIQYISLLESYMDSMNLLQSKIKDVRLHTNFINYLPRYLTKKKGSFLSCKSKKINRTCIYRFRLF